jgi:hypothetical protein
MSDGADGFVDGALGTIRAHVRVGAEATEVPQKIRRP